MFDFWPNVMLDRYFHFPSLWKTKKKCHSNFQPFLVTKIGNFIWRFNKVSFEFFKGVSTRFHFWPNILNELIFFAFLARQKQKTNKQTNKQTICSPFLSFEFAAISCHENRKFHLGFQRFHLNFLREFWRMFDFWPNVLNELYFQFPS